MLWYEYNCIVNHSYNNQTFTLVVLGSLKGRHERPMQIITELDKVYMQTSVIKKIAFKKKLKTSVY